MTMDKERACLEITSSSGLVIGRNSIIGVSEVNTYLLAKKIESPKNLETLLKLHCAKTENERDVQSPIVTITKRDIK